MKMPSSQSHLSKDLYLTRIVTRSVSEDLNHELSPIPRLRFLKLRFSGIAKRWQQIALGVSPRDQGEKKIESREAAAANSAKANCWRRFAALGGKWPRICGLTPAAICWRRFAAEEVQLQNLRFGLLLILLVCIISAPLFAADYTVTETEDEIHLKLPKLEATIKKTGYVSGVAGRSFLDKKTGFRDVGFGLDIVDWIMEPGSDEAYRDKLDKELIYQFNNSYHGKRPKRSIEGPQICTKAKRINTEVIKGEDFVAVKLWYQYQTAAPGKKTGSLWTQWLVFPIDKRYFFSMDRIDAVNSSEAMFLRTDLPGHIRHTKGDTFSQIYLSYLGKIPSSEFLENFAPDEKFHYLRNDDKIPERMIRAYQLRDPKTSQTGPWLAGMTLDPSVVSEAWCHQRGYVCMIQEFGGRPVKAGESFQAAYIIGYFDNIDEMHQVYDQHKGTIGLDVTKVRWKLVKQ